MAQFIKLLTDFERETRQQLNFLNLLRERRGRGGHPSEWATSSQLCLGTLEIGFPGKFEDALLPWPWCGYVYIRDINSPDIRNAQPDAFHT